MISNITAFSGYGIKVNIKKELEELSASSAQPAAIVSSEQPQSLSVEHPAPLNSLDGLSVTGITKELLARADATAIDNAPVAIEMAFQAVEVAASAVTAKENGETVRGTPAVALLNESTYETILKMGTLRNSVVHGSLSRSFDTSAARVYVSIARNLVAQLETVASLSRGNNPRLE